MRADTWRKPSRPRPARVYELAGSGHRIYIEKGAGEEARFSDEAYVVAGARLVADAVDDWSGSEVIVTVFDPMPEQYGYMSEGLAAFAFLAISVNRGLLWALLDSKCTAFSMETARDDKGDLSILKPINQIAGSLVPQIGAHYLQCSPRRSVLLAVRLGILRDA